MKRKITFLIAALFALALITKSLTAVGQEKSGKAYVRISSLSEISSGDKVIFATRYNSTANNYKAMQNTIATKIETTECVATTISGKQVLPSSITGASYVASYYWTVSKSSSDYTFTNPSNKKIGYKGSGTDFKADSNNDWNLASTTTSSSSMVASYSAWKIYNKSYTARTFALNNSSKIGPYDYANNSNANAGDYNFSIDIFVETNTYEVTYDCDGGSSGCPTSPVTVLPGSYTLASAPSKDGYTFQGWNDGTETYAAGYSYTISADVEFTAQWQENGSPNIVINEGNNLVLANTAVASQTLLVAYNNMDEYDTPTVELFDNSTCTIGFSGNWFYGVSLSGADYTTLNYSVKANEVGTRTVYVKVSTTYNEITYYSVISATQSSSNF